MKGSIGTVALVRIGALLAALGGLAPAACRSIGDEGGSGRESSVYGIVHSIGERRDGGEWIYAHLDELRDAVAISEAGERRLLTLAEHDLPPDPLFWQGVRELGMFSSVDASEEELQLIACECRDAGIADRLVRAFEATVLEEPPGNPTPLRGATWYAIRFSATCVTVIRTDQDDERARQFLPVAELTTLRANLGDLRADPGATALLRGRNIDFPWPIYDLLVGSPAEFDEQGPAITRRLCIEDYARACRHVDDGFEDGDDHCEAIQHFGITIDVFSDTMTWDLEYEDETLRAILEQAITSMAPAVAAAIALDWSASKQPWIRLRHVRPGLCLDDPAIDSLVEMAEH